MSRRTALIAGGGIAGLAAAIALSKVGFRCRILERNAAFSEAGAGIQIGPNGTRILGQLGVLDELAPVAGRPASLVVRDARSEAELSRLPLGDWIGTRHGSPYWTAHRADLHAALARVAAGVAEITVEFAFELTAVDFDAEAVRVKSSDGRTVEASILVGADGYASAVRRLVFGSFALEAAGRSASRTVIPNRDAVSAAYADHVGIWLAPRAHVVHYPVRGGQELAAVVVTTDEARTEGWGTATSRDAVSASLSGLSPRLLQLLDRGGDWRRWSLITSPRLGAWSKSRVVLVGDATGPIMPFLAQGAVMALEDAVTLASALQEDPNYTTSFARYETERRPRRHQVSEAAIRNGRIYHMAGPMALARNLALRVTPPGLVMGGYDWLYGYEAKGT